MGALYKMRNAYLEQYCRARLRCRAARPQPWCLSSCVSGCRVEGRARDVDTAAAVDECAARGEGRVSRHGGPREARLDSSVEQAALGITSAITAVCWPSIQCVVVAPFSEPVLLTRLAAATGWH